jgi:6-phosphogluconolactonase
MVCFYASEPASDPPNRDLLVPDLGTDAVLTYSLTTEGKLAEKTAARIATSPGAGPRHLRFHPNGRHLFILNELDSTLMMLRFEGTRFVAISTVSTLGAGSFPGSTAAELRVSASGGYVFASNRGPDSDNIAMFAFDENSEEMSLVHVEPSRGKVPRDIISSPDGRYLLVANQDTDTVVAFAIDEERPGLELANMTEVPTPVCLAFA